MKRFWAAVLGGGLLAAPAGAVTPDPKDLAVPPADVSKARLLVRKLGDGAFGERERAHDELAKMGRLAKPALVEALAADPHPEIRTRSARLLPRAEAADLQARIDTFLADADAKYTHDLPAWELYRKVVGADKAARDLYVEMLKNRSNLALLANLGAAPEECGRAVADRRLELFLQMNPHAFGNRFGGLPPTAAPKQPALADLAALFFAETVVPAKDIPRAGPFFITGANFIQQQSATAAVNNPAGTPHAGPFLLVLGKWLDSRTTPEDLNNIIHVAQTLRDKVKETGPLLRRVVTTAGVQGWAKGQALQFLVQKDAKAEQPFLKALLKDDTVVTQVWNVGGLMNQGTPVQLRDVALAMLLSHNGQDLKAYGYEFPAGVVMNGQVMGFGTYAFTSDEKRDAAVKKWAEWEAARDAAKKDEPKK